MPARDASFDQFVTANVRGLMNTAYLISCDEAAAEDLVQECLIRVAERWPRVRRMDTPAAYARRILVNLAIDERRSQGRRGAELIEFDLTDTRAEAALEAIAERAPLLAGLRRLSPRQRAVIVLRYFHDLSEQETARVLGCGVGTVKSSGARGLERLREIVEPQQTRARDDAASIQSGGTES